MSESPTSDIASEAEQKEAALSLCNMVTEDAANAITPGVTSATPAILVSESCNPATVLCGCVLLHRRALVRVVMWTPAPQMSHDRDITGRHIPQPTASRNL